MLDVYDLRCEYRENPVGIFTERPRFSWKIATDKHNVFQQSWALELALDRDFKTPLWQSGFRDSRESHLVPYGGDALVSSTEYFWRVKIRDRDGEESPWSKTASFSTSMLGDDEWKAVFITGERENAGADSAATLFRGEFTVNRDIKSARLYASAKGIYEAFCNGRRVGDEVLSPGFTEYRSRLLFQTYDVTDYIVTGHNVLGFLVAPGWYKGDLVNTRNIFGSRTAVIAQLRLEYAKGAAPGAAKGTATGTADKQVEIVSSSEGWKYAPAPLLFSEIYHGELYDARLEQAGWDKPGFSGSGWKPVLVESRDTQSLKPRDGLPVKEQEFLKPLKLFTTPRGEQVIDFGQNISGWVRFTVEGKAGERVKIRHAEILDAEGNFYTENLRKARQTVEYILRGNGVESYHPHCSFQGFRYIAIDEYPGEIDLDNFEAVAIHSNMRNAGELSCSNLLLNRFARNVRWSLKDNFVDIPSDCPQRDERLGWTGDANIFSRAACLLMETAPFFRKWLRDMVVSQFPDGRIPHVVPDVLNDRSPAAKVTGNAGACAWADAVTGVPWTVYTYFRDREILEESYPAMKKWVEYVRSVAQDGLIFNTGFHFGDWVALDAKEGSYSGATPNDLSATVYYAYSVEILAKTAKLLGKDEDAECYGKLREAIGAAFKNEFFTPSGRLAARTQTACTLVLNFGLCPPEYKKRCLDTLVALLAENKNHLTTGFLGTPYVLKVLSENGRLDLAYELLLKDDFPSWLYQVQQGATTVWEHWDGLKPDGTMWSPNMNSFNHYAYGSVYDWVFSVLGGVDTDGERPGFTRAMLKPRPGAGIIWADTAYESVYGSVKLRWELRDGNMNMGVEIPPNTDAEIILPGAEPGIIGGVFFTAAEGGAAAILGSGRYNFEYPWREA
ncbi:MAG: glycoside hydrolase family 78 protein [Treponema sp.]|jgi:alpha-L-rhamnosidase|nr:glycoside hydrolase family 78 protein [Treponema sp.]